MKATHLIRSNHFSNKRARLLHYFLLALACLPLHAAFPQGVHFSQYFNAPLLLNPANTALLPASDFRLGANFRRQWTSVPVPFQTISAYADLQLLRNQNITNWLGLGLAFFNDKAGSGELSLTKVEGFVAYHVQMGQFSMISVGASVGTVQRTVDFNKLTYDRQWDGFNFNRNMANGEDANIQRTRYMDVGAGVNLAWFPNEALYCKLGLGISHINQPRESFYNQNNRVSMRPNANFDVRLQVNPNFILNPSVYYTAQRGANQLTFGALMECNVTPEADEGLRTSLLFGGYHRLGESIIGAIGLQFNDIRLMSSYDFTVSTLSNANKGRGAMEIGIIYQGVYGDISRGRSSYGCPRF